MVNNHYKTGISLKRLFTGHIFVLLIMTVLAVFFVSCNSKVGEDLMVPLKTKEVPFSHWNDVFENHEIIPFTFADPEQELYTIGEMLVSPTGEYFIIDGRAGKILRFNPDGKFIQYIGRKGEGPGEFMIPGRPFMDSNYNFYIYDVVKRRLNQYAFPGYNFEEQSIIPSSLQHIILDKNENFIVYTVTEPDILYKIGRKGEVLKRAFRAKNNKFRIFSGRFELGRLSAITGNLFLLSYPEEYRIYLFDYQFRLKSVYYADSSSRFFPDKAVFPGMLSPYQYTPKHSKWWGQSLRPALVFYLGNRLFAMELIEYTNLSTKEFLNIHDLDGKTYAAGLEVPFNGIIRYAKDGYIYVLEESSLDQNNNVIPLKLHRFSLKKNLRSGF